MTKEEEFEKTLEGLSAEEQTTKRLEFEKSEKDDYRGKLNAQNRFLEDQGFEFKEGKWNKKPEVAKPIEAPKTNLSPVESVLLVQSGIAADDVNEVLEYANYRKLSISDALKDSTLQTIVKTRIEERKTAAATIVAPAGRQAPRETVESILDAASQGQLPESDAGVDRLAAARLESKRQKKSR